MLKLILNISGWFAIIVAGSGGYIRLFADDHVVRRYAGSRDLDTVLTILVFGLIFLALAAIIARLDKLLTLFEDGDD